MTEEILPLSTMTCPWGIWFPADLWTCTLLHMHSEQPLCFSKVLLTSHILQEQPGADSPTSGKRFSWSLLTSGQEQALWWQTLLCCILQTASYFLRHFSLKSWKKMPLGCFLFLSLDLQESFLKTYFSKDKNEKEYYFKFMTKCYRWKTLSINRLTK